MIFSIVCEELGFIGAALILALFCFLVLRGYWIALHARDRFGGLLAVGITTMIAVQTFLNVAVVTNFVPNTGISLPFFSYGGTALMIQLFEMGVLLSVSRQIRDRNRGKKKPGGLRIKRGSFHQKKRLPRCGADCVLHRNVHFTLRQRTEKR